MLPLVAGLFVLVEALDRSGLVALLGGLLRDSAQRSETGAAWAAGAAIALASNLMNNLPAGLIAAGAVEDAQASRAASPARSSSASTSAPISR